MEPSFRITQVETLLTAYSEATKRSGMHDLSVWHALCMYYRDPENWEIEVTSTKEEAFDRIIKDNWFVDMGDRFYGIDYETVDELVMKYLLDNHLATRTEEGE